MVGSAGRGVQGRSQPFGERLHIDDDDESYFASAGEDMSGFGQRFAASDGPGPVPYRISETSGAAGAEDNGTARSRNSAGGGKRVKAASTKRSSVVLFDVAGSSGGDSGSAADVPSPAQHAAGEASVASAAASSPGPTRVKRKKRTKQTLTTTLREDTLHLIESGASGSEPETDD